MKLVKRAVIFELRDMIGSPDCEAEIRVERQGTIYAAWVRAVPEPFYDGLFARIRSAWEVVCGRAYPTAWPKAGELEAAMKSYKLPVAQTRA
jgi:hypothetical protein